MDKSLTELCSELNNYFPVKKIAGRFTVEGGHLTGAEGLQLQDGQYYRVRGSVFNDGVHKYPTDTLKDEESFKGQIWSMAIPQEVIDLASDISDWNTQYGGASSPNMSPYNSESFGGYSYSKSAGAQGAGGAQSANSWQSAFASRLAKFRRLRGIEQ